MCHVMLVLIVKYLSMQHSSYFSTFKADFFCSSSDFYFYVKVGCDPQFTTLFYGVATA